MAAASLRSSDQLRPEHAKTAQQLYAAVTKTGLEVQRVYEEGGSTSEVLAILREAAELWGNLATLYTTLADELAAEERAA